MRVKRSYYSAQILSLAACAYSFSIGEILPRSRVRTLRCRRAMSYGQEALGHPRPGRILEDPGEKEKKYINKKLYNVNNDC